MNAISKGTTDPIPGAGTTNIRFGTPDRSVTINVAEYGDRPTYTYLRQPDPNNADAHLTAYGKFGKYAVSVDWLVGDEKPTVTVTP